MNQIANGKTTIREIPIELGFEVAACLRYGGADEKEAELGEVLRNLFLLASFSNDDPNTVLPVHLTDEEAKAVDYALYTVEWEKTDPEQSQQPWEARASRSSLRIEVLYDGNIVDREDALADFAATLEDHLTYVWEVRKL